MRNLRILHNGHVCKRKAHWFLKIYPDADVIGEVIGPQNDFKGIQKIRETVPPEVADALHAIPRFFPALIRTLAWEEVVFISDMPGKNRSEGLGGGGRASQKLVDLIGSAEKSVTVQSPYLVMPEGGLELFRKLCKRGVTIRISTNSLSSTDNLQAFSGYAKQRSDILETGVDVYEYRPDPMVQKELIERYERISGNAPVFAIHAKTMIVDGETLFVGTFNLDPRSLNLNTEVGILVRNRQLAGQVEAFIEKDMAPENSWDARADQPDRFAPWVKRVKVFFWKLLPLEPIL